MDRVPGKGPDTSGGTCGCGAPMQVGASYCGECGRKIEFTPVEDKISKSTCPACGAGMPDGVRFCRGCGVRLEEVLLEVTSIRTDNARLILVGMLLIVVAALGAGYFYMYAHQPSIPASLSSPTSAFGALYPVRVGGKMGYIDRQGKLAINPQFNWAWPFAEGLAQVRVGKLRFVCEHGRRVERRSGEFPGDHEVRA